MKTFSDLVAGDVYSFLDGKHIRIVVKVDKTHPKKTTIQQLAFERGRWELVSYEYGHASRDEHSLELKVY